MGQDLNIDSHKLMYHPDRVAKWMNGEEVYPIGIEITPSRLCNHRCTFCAVDYMNYENISIEKDLILQRLDELASKGLKSVVLAGEGEPLLNNNIVDIINGIKTIGLDVSMSTNGVLLTEQVSKECLHSLTWIRFSVAAGTEETYKKIHRCKVGDFDIVFKNISDAVKIKRQNKLNTTIGVQMLLTPENVEEVVTLGEKLKDIGVDYFTVKPFSKHPKSVSNIDEDFNYNHYYDIQQELKKLETGTYKIYFRLHSMNKLIEERPYKTCLGLPFFVYLDAEMNLWPCIAFMGDETMSYGNLKNHTFEEVWKGKKRKEIIKYFDDNGTTDCREICRLDEINRYLNKLKSPGLHVNFI